MKKQMILAGVLAFGLALAGCSGNDAANSESIQESSAAQSSSASAASSDAAVSAAQSEEVVVEEEVPADAAAVGAQSLAGAYASIGGYPSTIYESTSDSGNLLSNFTVDDSNAEIYVDVTQASNGNTAQMTFDANCAADLAMDMTVMNEWTANGSTVRVIRNNMANTSYVEVLDNNAQIAIHIQNQLPEQLETSLSALQAAGYPVYQ